MGAVHDLLPLARPLADRASRDGLTLVSTSFGNASAACAVPDAEHRPAATAGR